MNTVTRDDTLIVGPLYPETSVFIMAVDIGDSDVPVYYPVVYGNFRNRFYVGPGTMSYLAGVGDQSTNYQDVSPVYFRYYTTESGVRFQHYSDPEGEDKLGSVSGVELVTYPERSNVSIFRGTREQLVNTSMTLTTEGDVKYNYPGGESILTGVRYGISVNTAIGIQSEIVFITYDSSGKVQDGEYAGLPTGISGNGTYPQLGVQKVIFLPVNWFTAVNGNSVSNLIYPYCTPQRKINKPSTVKEPFFQNFCVDDEYLPRRGYTNTTDQEYAQGILYYYGDGNNTCGAPWSGPHTNLFGEQVQASTTYAPVQNEGEYCVFDSGVGKFVESSSLPPPIFCNDLLAEKCPNLPAICSKAGACPNCPDCPSICTTSALKSCANSTQLCIDVGACSGYSIFWMIGLIVALVVIVILICLLVWSFMRKPSNKSST